MKTTFIYFLRDPENPIKGYVGKTKNPKTRLSAHMSPVCNARSCRANWINSLVARGLRPAFEIVAEVPVADWLFWERSYIRLYRCLGFELTNGNSGGGGPHEHTEETCAKFRARTGRKLSPDSCARISAAKKLKNWMRGRTGELHPMFGKKHKPETLVKMSVDRKGRIPWNKGKTGLQVAWNKGNKKA